MDMNQALADVDVRALDEMTKSAGWAEWLKWSAAMRASLAESALRHDDPKVREECRMEMLALEKFERLPQFILNFTQEG